MCPTNEANEQGEVKQKILVADDEASIRRILETRLGMIGYDVVTAADGEATINGQFTITAMCAAIYRNDSSAREFIDFIDDAIDNVSLRSTKIGAYMNRLDSAIESTDVQRENLIEANSTIKDSDVATESSNYIKYQILQQSTATLLATANQMPSIALNLI